ncbi:hypothetical protein MAPG_04853 [Magnaporthiopsis poae ATCC 64411]|uniref:Rhodopsin domain-containing protein n=1 Tax=Magnaporthiopsis poae (strain ATCC 64411 / 73-15) TaxID=644358 RepID=A0A0C4DXU6_MAGP6|nr:hypothetical protein MAPG_04853 [Magnaporthiopsis poae ATCC 64411]
MAPDQIRTETTGPTATGVAVLFMVLTVFFTSLRFFTRATILKAIGKDDWAVLLATAFCFTCAVATCFEVKYGMGRHIENVTPFEMVEQMRVRTLSSFDAPVSNSLQFLMVAIYTYNLGMHSVKLAFLFQYRRIFRSKTIQTICFWFILYVCIWAIVQTTLSSLTCIPVAIVYPAMADKCINPLLIWYITAGMSMFTDLAIFCIPLQSVWQLQLPMRQKVMVMGIFCLGFFSYYIRHGGSTADGTKHGSVLNKLTTAATPSRDRSTVAEGASTEDLALESKGHEGAGGTRGSFHAGASSGFDHTAGGFSSEDPERAGRIMMTTEITVDSGRRMSHERSAAVSAGQEELAKPRQR